MNTTETNQLDNTGANAVDSAAHLVQIAEERLRAAMISQVGEEEYKIRAGNAFSALMDALDTWYSNEIDGEFALQEMREDHNAETARGLEDIITF